MQKLNDLPKVKLHVVCLYGSVYVVPPHQAASSRSICGRGISAVPVFIKRRAVQRLAAHSWKPLPWTFPHLVQIGVSVPSLATSGPLSTIADCPQETARLYLQLTCGNKYLIS